MNNQNMAVLEDLSEFKACQSGLVVSFFDSQKGLLVLRYQTRRTGEQSRELQVGCAQDELVLADEITALLRDDLTLRINQNGSGKAANPELLLQLCNLWVLGRDAESGPGQDAQVFNEGVLALVTRNEDHFSFDVILFQFFIPSIRTFPPGCHLGAELHAKGAPSASEIKEKEFAAHIAIDGFRDRVTGIELLESCRTFFIPSEDGDDLRGREFSCLPVTLRRLCH